ncbi:MAG TPA: tRNA-dihydrouridine synthase family protein [Vicinamibacterales bacterium]|nr:tRNA-dihydrouridine synthase family protein [Vicinamibacterales bacterium]
MTLRDRLSGALVMAPMTKGSNLPYRRLCVELGARVLISEMVVARRLKQRRRSEFALIRRAPDEPVFAVQLAGNKPEEMAWAAALAESRGSDFIDINLGCPIDHFTRMGLGAALGRQPTKVGRIVAAMYAAVKIPVTVKIRLGWSSDSLNYMTLARAAVDGGAAAVFVHGRTREARYRHPADWTAIAEIAAALEVPVIGNGDVLFGQDVQGLLDASGATAVMSARGVLIKPWIFREVEQGYWDITADERVSIYRRYVTLALEHWGGDEFGRTRIREFLRWHAGFWCRYAPRREDGSWPSMQARESAWTPRSPLEALLARSDDAALDYVTDELLAGGDLSRPPAVGSAMAADADLVEAG